ncbi:MAG: phosphoglycerate dehydrogenase [Pseudomonadota bacterium]|nr:phosphoglycerate dehydrogenase [Pseudomonadota bacterium]
MYKIRTYNAISSKGLYRLSRDCFEVSSDINAPNALLLRSYKLSDADIDDSVSAIARAGAGVNNIPIEHCTERGIVVFNTPGANANAVKELVAAGMLLASRDIVGGMRFISELDPSLSAEDMGPALEANKKQFAGSELQGKTLGVLGLGAIGSLIARLGLDLGMEVVGYDPAISVEAAWRLPSSVKKMDNMQSLFARSDYVSLHIPVLDSTRGLINADTLSYFKKNACLLNFARDQIVNTDAVVAALDQGQLRTYVTDFPHPALRNRSDTILMPHIGASTAEAEENCAVMAADQIKAFLDHGNIKNSVNFPAIELERTTESRLTVTNRNAPGTLSHILNVLGDANLNVADLLNKSRGDIAYNLIDLNSAPTPDVLDKVSAVDGVINVRYLGKPCSI